LQQQQQQPATNQWPQHLKQWNYLLTQLNFAGDKAMV
jgi:hypothetical protein